MEFVLVGGKFWSRGGWFYASRNLLQQAKGASRCTQSVNDHGVGEFFQEEPPKILYILFWLVVEKVVLYSSTILTL